MKSIAIVAALAGTAVAEPCPQMNLVPEVIQAFPDKPKETQVTADGGLVVVEMPRAWDGGKKPDPDTSKWQLRAGGKTTKPELTAIAPGMWLVKTPAGATTFSLEDSSKKAKGRARVVAKAPAPLPAPSIRAVISGDTKSHHVTRFVGVELIGTAPKGVQAMVLVDAKGQPLSWGTAWDGADRLTVYSTQSGCVTTFPNGTVIAQPGDKVAGFWVDSTGRRSPDSAPVIVQKP